MSSAQFLTTFARLRLDGFLFDARATASGLRHLGLGGEGVGGGDGAEDEEQDRVGRDVEIEIDEAVEQQAGNSSDGGGVDGAGEVTLLGFVRTAGVAK
jgi:hypothetical protein